MAADFLGKLQAALLPHTSADNCLLLVGFSGGRDSVALLLGAYCLAQGELAGRYRLAAAHLNHNLRGEEAAADADFCRDFCAQRGIEFATATAEGLFAGMPNAEQQARAARYAWFEELRRQYEGEGYCPCLLTAHHLADQAETVLLHLLRGSGTAGLMAMQEQNGWHLRPLLGFSRGEITAFLEEQGVAWREDSSNKDLAYTRNFVRAEVLPVLRRLNPQAERALAQTAELCRADEEFLAAEAAARLGRAEIADGKASYPWAELAAEPLAIRRRLVRALWQGLTGAAVCGLTYRQVEAVLGLLPGQSVNLSGAVLAARRGKRLVLLLPSPAHLAARRAKSRKGQAQNRKKPR